MAELICIENGQVTERLPLKEREEGVTPKCVLVNSHFQKKIVSYSWMEMQLDKYLGQAIDYRYKDEILYFFYCKKFKHIYLDEEDLHIAYNAAIRHEMLGTANILKLAIDDMR